MKWFPARSWTVVKDRNYYHLCEYCLVIYLNGLDLNLTFVADHLKKVDVFIYDRVPRHSQIVQLTKDSAFIETLK